MHALHDPERVRRLGYALLWCLALWLVWSEPGLALAATGGGGKIKLANIGQDIYTSLADFSIYAGAALFSAGAIPALIGRELNGITMGLMGTGVGVSFIQYVPDFISGVATGRGALL